MTIDRDELINLLMEKTGMDREKVEKQLDELNSRIVDAAYRGKALEIKGFGLFYFDEDGELTFRASDQLDTEINFTHAGMKPIEIEPSKSGSALSGKELSEETEDDLDAETESMQNTSSDSDTLGEADDDSDLEDIFGIENTLSADKGEEEEDKDDSEVPEPFDKLIQDEPDEVKSVPGAQPKDRDKVKKAGTAPAQKASSTSKTKRKAVTKSRDPMTTVILIVLAAVFLFAAYFVFTEFLDPPEQPETAQQQDIELENPPATAERDVTEATEPEDPEPEQVPEPEDDPEPLDDPIDEVMTTDPYGLYGELAETEGDIFTIVVHSLESQNVASRTADELRSDGFRISVTEVNVDGQTYYRVGIGQFPTVQEALQEATTLPDPFNNQNFIQRLQ